MSKSSAGLLLFRFAEGAPEVMLVHMGGPFWQRRDASAWSIPKGEYRFPEVDRAAWFDLESAQEKLVRGQVPLLERLARAAERAKTASDAAEREPPPGG